MTAFFSGDGQRALLVVDVQNSFLPGGSLAVPQGEEIIPVINQLAKQFSNVVLTQDWHPADHISFASQHPGKQPFELITLDYGEQCLWPEHCIQESEGAALAAGLKIDHARLILRKGIHRHIDSYSAFTEADGKTTTGLAAWLQANAITEVFIAGLATDFCVAWTAKDARLAGFTTWVIEDVCRGIDLNHSVDIACRTLRESGVKMIYSADLNRSRAT